MTREPAMAGASLGPWPTAWVDVRRRRLARCGLALIAAMALVALMADFLASDLPLAARYQGRVYLFPNLLHPAALLAEDQQSLRAKAEPGDWSIRTPVPFGPTQFAAVLSPPPAAPDGVHWLGTDDRGRDVMARLIHGTRPSLAVGFVAVALMVFIGMIVGAAAGYLGGGVDLLLSRIIEVVVTFPTFFLVLALTSVIERPTILGVMMVLGLTGWTGIARLVRAELKLAGQEFVVAARAQGLRPVRVILSHVLPNTLGPVLVSATFGVAAAVLIEASLSFLGFGTPPPSPSWGDLLRQALENGMPWWLALPPGLAIFATVVSYNLVGEALRDALDPRLRQT
jgi:peptide/nickel transport system permease protein